MERPGTKVSQSKQGNKTAGLAMKFTFSFHSLFHALISFYLPCGKVDFFPYPCVRSECCPVLPDGFH